jgi:hypothetical protein
MYILYLWPDDGRLRPKHVATEHNTVVLDWNITIYTQRGEFYQVMCSGTSFALLSQFSAYAMLLLLM